MGEIKMANKHITNPCSLGGTPAPSPADTAYWVDPTTNTTRVLCPECYAFISINRKNKAYRRHNIGENSWLTKTTNPSVVTGVQNVEQMNESYDNMFALKPV